MLFNKQIILFDELVETRQEAESLLADQFMLEGVGTEQFGESILKREAEFPTGLNTETVGIAIPHTDSDKVLIPQIGFMRLKTPVTFKQMGDNSPVAVKLIFMLALRKSEDQLKMLQTLMALFQDSQKVDRLLRISDKQEFLKIMNAIGIK